ESLVATAWVSKRSSTAQCKHVAFNKVSESLSVQYQDEEPPQLSQEEPLAQEEAQSQLLTRNLSPSVALGQTLASTSYTFPNIPPSSSQIKSGTTSTKSEKEVQSFLPTEDQHSECPLQNRRKWKKVLFSEIKKTLEVINQPALNLPQGSRASQISNSVSIVAGDSASQELENRLQQHIQGELISDQPQLDIHCRFLASQEQMHPQDKFPGKSQCQKNDKPGSSQPSQSALTDNDLQKMEQPSQSALAGNDLQKMETKHSERLSTMGSVTFKLDFSNKGLEPELQKEPVDLSWSSGSTSGKAQNDKKEVSESYLRRTRKGISQSDLSTGLEKKIVEKILQDHLSRKLVQIKEDMFPVCVRGSWLAANCTLPKYTKPIYLASSKYQQSYVNTVKQLSFLDPGTHLKLETDIMRSRNPLPAPSPSEVQRTMQGTPLGGSQRTSDACMPSRTYSHLHINQQSRVIRRIGKASLEPNPSLDMTRIETQKETKDVASGDPCSGVTMLEVKVGTQSSTAGKTKEIDVEKKSCEWEVTVGASVMRVKVKKVLYRNRKKSGTLKASGNRLKNLMESQNLILLLQSLLGKLWDKDSAPLLVSEDVADFTLWVDTTCWQVESGGLSFINSDVQMLLEMLITKRVELKVWKKNSKNGSSFKQMSPDYTLYSLGNMLESLGSKRDTTAQTFWNTKEKPEKLHDSQNFFYNKVLGGPLEKKYSQLFWGLPSLHSESLVATAWVSKRSSTAQCKHVAFNKVSESLSVQYQDEEPPQLSQEEPLAQEEAQSQLLTQNLSPSVALGQTLASTSYTFPNIPPSSSQIKSGTTSTKSEKEVQSFLPTEDQHSECPLQNRRKWKKVLFSEIKKTLEVINQPALNLPQGSRASQISNSVSIVAGDSASQELENRLQQHIQGELISDQPQLDIHCRFLASQEQMHPQDKFPGKSQCQKNNKPGSSQPSQSALTDNDLQKMEQPSQSALAASSDYRAISIAKIGSLLEELPQKSVGKRVIRKISFPTLQNPLPAPSPSEVQRTMQGTPLGGSQRTSDACMPSRTYSHLHINQQSRVIRRIGKASLEPNPSLDMTRIETQKETKDVASGDPCSGVTMLEVKVGTQSSTAGKTKELDVEKKSCEWEVTVGASVMANSKTINVNVKNIGSLGNMNSPSPSRISISQDSGDQILKENIGNVVQLKVEFESEEQPQDMVTGVLQDCHTNELSTTDILPSQVSLSNSKSFFKIHKSISQALCDDDMKAGSSQEQEESKVTNVEVPGKEDTERICINESQESFGRSIPKEEEEISQDSGLSPSDKVQEINTTLSKSFPCLPEKGQNPPVSYSNIKMRDFMESFNNHQKGKGKENSLNKVNPLTATTHTQKLAKRQISKESVVVEPQALITVVGQILMDKLGLERRSGPTEVYGHKEEPPTLLGRQFCQPRGSSYPDKRQMFREIASGPQASPNVHSPKNKWIRDNNWTFKSRNIEPQATPFQLRPIG
ncbi:Hypothetical predicted protein, partial [Marmota monax]